MTRVDFSRLVKAEALRRCGNRCAACNKPLFADYQFDHINPCAFVSDGSVDNCMPMHVACHANKTAADIKTIAKSNRIRRRHAGIKPDRVITAWTNFRREIVRMPRKR